MKKILSALSFAIMLIACNNNKPKNTATFTSEDGKEQVTVDMNEMKNAAQDMEKIKAQLSTLTPLTTDQLKALVPEKLMGAERKDLDVTAAMGASVASASYQLNDSTDIKLNMFDCAGPGGAGIYSMQYLGMFNVQQDDDEEYTKTIDFNGGKAFENCKKIRKECTLTYFSGGRFLITLEGNNVGIDGLKQAAKGLDIK